MRTALLILSYFLLFTSHAQSVSWTWGRQVGGTDFDSAGNTITDASGNTIQVGAFRGSMSFGTTTLTCLGDMALYLVKYNSQGQLLWAQQAGDAPGPSSSIGGASGLSLTTDLTGNIYVVGSFNGSITFGSTTLTAPIGPTSAAVNTFVCKYSSSGNPIWAVLGGGLVRTDGFDIAVDNASGSVVVTGSYQGSAAFGTVSLVSQGADDIFIAKYTSQGSFVWARSVGGSSQDYGNSIAIDNQSNVYVAGVIKNAASFGAINIIGYGDSDAFVAKFNLQGTVQWVKDFGGTGYDEGVQVALDNNGGFYLAGDFEQSAVFSTINLTSQGAGDGFLVRGDSQGNVLWAKQLSGPRDEAFLNVKVAGNGGVYLGGIFSSPIASFDSQPFVSAGGADILLMRCDLNGNFVWGQRGGGTANDFPAGLSIDASGGISLGCNFYGNPQYGPFSFTNRGLADAVVLHLQDNTLTAVHPAYNQIELSVYPNPVRSSSPLTLSVPEAGYPYGTAIVEVINCTGQVVKRFENLPNTSSQVNLDIPNCPAGIYTIIYKRGGKTGYLKLSII